MHDDLPHAMRETARRLEPDVVRLAAGGVTRGTRMRRVERVVQVLGSVVAVAAVFAGVALFGPHRGAGAGMPSASGDTGTATAPGDTTTAATSPSSTGPPQISKDELISTLKTGIGGYGVTGRSYVAHGSEIVSDAVMDSPSAISVGAQLSAQHHVGFIDIGIYAPRDHVPSPGAPHLLRSGSVVYVSQEAGSSDGRHHDRIDLHVTLVRSDGSTLSALETNASNAKSAAVSGAPLLLTSDQVTTMLDSPAWDDAIAATVSAASSTAALPHSATSPTDAAEPPA